jgi:hypothetical protein
MRGMAAHTRPRQPRPSAAVTAAQLLEQAAALLRAIAPVLDGSTASPAAAAPAPPVAAPGVDPFATPPAPATPTTATAARAARQSRGPSKKNSSRDSQQDNPPQKIPRGEKRAAIASALRNNPAASIAELAALAGCSRSHAAGLRQQFLGERVAAPPTPNEPREPPRPRRAAG